jgi:peptide/nickel transport system permease protein
MSIEAVEAINQTGGGLPYAGAPQPPPERQLPASRSLFRQAVADTLSNTLARAGLCWLLILTFFAVFAPFIANTHPIAMKMGGHWNSPLLKNLTPSDVLVLIAGCSAIMLGLSRRFSFGLVLLIVTASVLIAALPCFLLIKPPENVDYTQYRTWAAAGRVQRAIYTIIPYSPRDRLRDQPDARLSPPGRQHWLGTDTNGSDLLSELIHASRIAISIGFIATGISLMIGVIAGGLMGYFAGLLDLLGMRFIEIFESIPRLFLLILVTAFAHQRNIYLMMVVIGLTGWTGYARFLRAEFFTLRKRDFVQAAVAAGLPERTVVFRHMLPNGLTPILVSTTFGVASAILYESTLSFLGLGLVDEASWGALLNQARAGGTGFIWWIASFPGLMIFLTVFAYNLVGEAIRDALDPRLQKQR